MQFSCAVVQPRLGKSLRMHCASAPRHPPTTTHPLPTCRRAPRTVRCTPPGARMSSRTAPHRRCIAPRSACRTRGARTPPSRAWCRGGRARRRLCGMGRCSGGRTPGCGRTRACTPRGPPCGPTAPPGGQAGGAGKGGAARYMWPKLLRRFPQHSTHVRTPARYACMAANACRTCQRVHVHGQDCWTTVRRSGSRTVHNEQLHVAP